jgi:hypothetical protein
MDLKNSTIFPRKQYNPNTVTVSEDEFNNQGVSLNLFDETNPDLQLFNIVDQELISLAGSEFYYYKFHPDDNYDKTFNEERIKQYSNKILVKGHYSPFPIGEEITKFGIQMVNENTFTFNREYIREKIGRYPIPGDAIQPRFQSVMFEVIEAQEESFQSYGVYHILVTGRIRKELQSLITESIPN